MYVPDEMYAAIEEPHQAVYTSGSETYAQITPMVVSAVINPVRTESLQPPVHALTSVKNHSRQGISDDTIFNITDHFLIVYCYGYT